MDIELIKTIREGKKRSILVTIIATKGPTPREIGTQMLVYEDGTVLGTIGGGFGEKHILELIENIFKEHSEFQGEIIKVNVNSSGDTKKLLQCNASIEVLLENTDKGDFFKRLKDENILEGSAIITNLKQFERVFIKEISEEKEELVLPMEKVREAVHNKKSIVMNNSNEQYLVEPILFKEKILILGAGHVAKKVAFHLQDLDFDVTIVDERPDLAKEEFFPEGFHIDCGNFQEKISTYKFNWNTYVIITTWSHEKDAECLEAVLKHNLKYVGMIGSRRKVQAIKERMVEKNYSIEELNKLRSPIGLPIGAETPEEIAISIVAELITFRRGKSI